MVKTNEDNESRELTNARDVSPPTSSTQGSAFVGHASFRSGPIPSPEEFEGYKRVGADFPERILSQFEKDSIANRELQKEAQAANIELSKRSLESEIEFEKRSQWMAFLAIVGFVGGTIFLAYIGRGIEAGMLGIGAVLGVFKGVFTKNKLPKHQDNDTK